MKSKGGYEGDRELGFLFVHDLFWPAPVYRVHENVY